MDDNTRDVLTTTIQVGGGILGGVIVAFAGFLLGRTVERERWDRDDNVRRLERFSERKVALVTIVLDRVGRINDQTRWMRGHAGAHREYEDHVLAAKTAIAELRFLADRATVTAADAVVDAAAASAEYADAHLGEGSDPASEQLDEVAERRVEALRAAFRTELGVDT
jgi:hypothetical protein